MKNLKNIKDEVLGVRLFAYLGRTKDFVRIKYQTITSQRAPTPYTTTLNYWSRVYLIIYWRTSVRTGMWLANKNNNFILKKYD